MPNRWHSHRAIVDLSRAPPRNLSPTVFVYSRLKLRSSWRNRWYFISRCMTR